MWKKSHDVRKELIKMKIGFGDKWSRDIVAKQKDPDKRGKRLKLDRRAIDEVYMSDRKKEKLLEEFNSVVVHDYGDGYHQSEKEKEKENVYYKEFSKLSKSKHKYKDLGQFVTVMRQVLKCLDMVAQNNMLYDPNTFKEMWLAGKIDITGLFLPQYKGKDKKQIAWDYVVDFILSDKDVSLLMPEEDDEYRSEEELLEYQKGLYTKEELDEIFKTDEKRDEKIRDDISNGVDHYDCVATPLPRKKLKKMKKMYPGLFEAFRDQNKVIKKNEELVNTFKENDLESEDFRRIRRYDAKRNMEAVKKMEREMPEFTGNILDKDDFNRYMYEFETWRKENTKKDYYGRLKTEADIEEMEVKSIQEENGWNIRNLYDNRQIEDSMRRAQKKMKKKERDIKDKLIQIQKRNNKLKKKLEKKELKKNRINQYNIEEEYGISKKKKKKGKEKKHKRRNSIIF